jgi:hypothetical protein
MYANNQLLFPHSLIPQLRNVRGPEWAALVDHVQQVPEGHEDSLAFVLTMIRLNGCLICETDSYRAMRGCDACAIQTLRRFKGTDAELLANYRQALDEVQRHLISTGRSVSA